MIKTKKLVPRINIIMFQVNKNSFILDFSRNSFQVQFCGQKENILRKQFGLLEYKIEITPINQSLGETNVIYFKMGMYGYNTNPNINTKMHIAGYLDGNTWTWNPYQITRH
jgi:hypothetical protein